jgi:hypothetical protein
VALNTLITIHGGHEVRSDGKGGTGSLDVINPVLCFTLSVLPPLKFCLLMKHGSEVVARSEFFFSAERSAVTFLKKSYMTYILDCKVFA